MFFTMLIACATLATATTLADSLPLCSISCFLAGIQKINCDYTDAACLCRNAAALAAETDPCIRSACSVEDQIKVVENVREDCASIGIPINIPGDSPADTPAPTAGATAPLASEDAASGA